MNAETIRITEVVIMRAYESRRSDWLAACSAPGQQPAIDDCGKNPNDLVSK